MQLQARYRVDAELTHNLNQGYSKQHSWLLCVQLHKVVISHNSQKPQKIVPVHANKQTVCMANAYLPMPLRYQAALGQPTSPLLLLRRFPALLCRPGCTEHNTACVGGDNLPDLPMARG